MIIPVYLVINLFPSGKFDNVVGVCIIDIQKYFLNDFDLVFYVQLI